MEPAFLQRALRSVRKRAGIPPALVRRRFLQREIVVRDGTIRPIPDYDDAWLLACAWHAGIVFDVGANVGYDTLLALASPRVELVLLVEANPDALAVAAENLIRNHLAAKCRFITAFAGETHDSEIRFWTVGTGAAGSVYPDHARSAKKRDSSIRVPTTTIDAVCDSHGVIPDLVKADVEGAEHQVLAGCRQCVSHRRTRFLVEMHSNPELPMAENAARVLDWCRSVDYRAWYLKEAALLEDPAPIERRGRCHLLLQPTDWSYPDWMGGIEQSSDLETVWERLNAAR